jgi:hypothetical protein
VTSVIAKSESLISSDLVPPYQRRLVNSRKQAFSAVTNFSSPTCDKLLYWLTVQACRLLKSILSDDIMKPNAAVAVVSYH